MRRTKKVKSRKTCGCSYKNCRCSYKNCRCKKCIKHHRRTKNKKTQHTRGGTMTKKNRLLWQKAIIKIIDAQKKQENMIKTITNKMQKGTPLNTKDVRLLQSAALASSAQARAFATIVDRTTQNKTKGLKGT